MQNISRRRFLTSGSAVASISASGQSGATPEGREQPNVLLIVADQLTAGVLGCYGGPVPTPNIDRLAREGVKFTDATCVTPFCSPSRASIVTGMYPHRHGILHNVSRCDYPAHSAQPTEEGIKRQDITTEGILHQAGYSTHHYGKWHLTEDCLPYLPDMYGEHHEYAHEMAETFHEVKKRPRERWMDWYGWAMPVAVDPALARAVEALGGQWREARFAEFVTKMGRLELPLEKVFDVRVADRTVERMRAIGDKPFMITCSFNYPHDPNVAPSPYYERFSPEAIELPGNFEDTEERFENDWSRRIVADLGEAGVREFLRIYYASVQLIDDQIGPLLSG